MAKKRQGHKDGLPGSYMDLTSPKMDIKPIMKDIEFLGSKHMTWKEREALEKWKSSAPKEADITSKCSTCNNEEAERKRTENATRERIVGRLGGKYRTDTKRLTEKRKLEDRVLKSSVGTFRNGVLDVEHLLQPAASASRDGDNSSHGSNKGGKRKGIKNNQKKKGGGRKRH